MLRILVLIRIQIIDITSFNRKNGEKIYIIPSSSSLVNLCNCARLLRLISHCCGAIFLHLQKNYPDSLGNCLKFKPNTQSVGWQPWSREISPHNSFPFRERIAHGAEKIGWPAKLSFFLSFIVLFHY